MQRDLTNYLVLIDQNLNACRLICSFKLFGYKTDTSNTIIAINNNFRKNTIDDIK